MKLFATLVLLFSLALVSCRKAPSSQAPEEKIAASANYSASLPQDGAPPPPPPPPSADGGSVDEATAGPRVQPMDVESLNTVIGDYMASKDRIPKDFNEMVRLKLIPHVPKPPAGFKYEIDQVRGKVIVKKI